MKKIISLTIFVGLIAILFPLFFSYAQASNGSSKSLLMTGNGTEPEQADPPWYDAAWNYRHPVTISYSGTTLPWYQVLVTLDSTNFNFSRAKADGSDVRFTHSDGTTDLKFWIESWVYGERAYIWVRVPSLTNGDTTIYLYYDNPNASTVSNGVATFDGFEDDWSLFTDGGLAFDGGGQISHHANEIESPFTWETIIGTPTASSGILSLTDGTGIESNSTYQNYAVGMRANFGLGSGREWGGFIDGSSGPQTMIGDIPLDPTNLYLINYRNNYENILLPREDGVDWHGAYHVYEVRWTSTKSVGDIDHGASMALSTKLTPDDTLPVTLYSNTGSAATLMVDWVYARQYRDPEPTSFVDAEQGLVELGINIADSPDPSRVSAQLTYQLIISNTSMIAAPGVVVTDTLPGGVQFFSAEPSQGSCVGSIEIVCNIYSISASTTATITIIVIPTDDGLITNTVSVDSPGFELDMSDNLDETITWVESIPPNVNWEKPVLNGQDYTTNGGWVALAASATDNDQVSSVEFLLYDHFESNPDERWKSQGIDFAYPYQIQFDSEILVPNVGYQMFVRATDRAGNMSNPLNPLRAIYIHRTLQFFEYLSIVMR